MLFSRACYADYICWQARNIKLMRGYHWHHYVSDNDRSACKRVAIFKFVPMLIQIYRCIRIATFAFGFVCVYVCNAWYAWPMQDVWISCIFNCFPKVNWSPPAPARYKSAPLRFKIGAWALGCHELSWKKSLADMCPKKGSSKMCVLKKDLARFLSIKWV